MVPLLNGGGGLVMKDMEKSDVLNVFLTSVFSGKISLQVSSSPEIIGKVWSNVVLPMVEDDHMREHLNKLDMHNSMGPDSLHS